MSVHQCPKCDLRFEWRTELDDHCSNDHPEFRHEYPATVPASRADDEHFSGHPVARRPIHLRLGDMANWLVPRRR